jgi:hypothetical protein
MKKALLAAAAGFAVVAAGFSGVAEARCFRIGHHWSCGHHRLHYSHRLHYRSWAAGYGYAYPYPYYYGASYPYSGSSSLGPRPNGGNGP